jgi:hypothetical protein
VALANGQISYLYLESVERRSMTTKKKKKKKKKKKQTPSFWVNNCNFIKTYKNRRKTKRAEEIQSRKKATQQTYSSVILLKHMPSKASRFSGPIAADASR